MEIVATITITIVMIFIIAACCAFPIGLYHFIREPYKDDGDWIMIIFLSLICALEACGFAALIIKYLEVTP